MVTSNLYAERIYAEHPIALWSLDDNANYTRLASDASLDLPTFTLSGTTAINITSFVDYATPPITSATTTEFTLTVPTANNTTASATHGGIIVASAILNGFTISFHYYAANPYIKKVRVGWKLAGVSQAVQEYTISNYNAWNFVTQTFSSTANQTIQPYIEFVYDLNSTFAPSNDVYTVLINGFSVGYSSEDFNKSSIGISQSNFSKRLDNIINGISFANTYGYVADSYGTSDTTNNGYYVARNNTTNQNGTRLYAKNAQIPMVYGSNNSTIIYPNVNSTTVYPSIIFPAQGFLNKYGKYNQYTFEFWLRLRSLYTVSAQKIFGPVNSTDGLYVNRSSLVLKIGNKSGSHYIGEFYRPMLIDIRYSPTQASLLVNGEVVISLTLEDSDINFIDKTTSSKSNDWVGFYAYATTNVSFLEIDCVALYPYIVDSALAKRRYAFGQGVEFPQNIDIAYKGKSYLVDFNVAEYANNIKYPRVRKWTEGINDNFDISDDTLSTPSFPYPSVKFADSSKTIDTWYATQSSTSTFTLATSAHNGYFYFESMTDILNNSNITSFAIPCTAPSAYVANQNETVFKIVNKNTNDYIAVKLVPGASTTSATLQYFYKMGSGTETVIDSTLNYTVAASATFSAGIDFNTFINYYKTTLGSSFNNQSNLKIYIGNDESFALPFRGSFSAVGFMNNYNFAKVSSWFTSKGIVTASTTFATVRDWGYTYRLTLKLTANIASAYTLNIDSSCVWNGSIPIQTLSSYNTSTNNYELDFIQFNIDFPEPCTFASNNYTTTLLDVKTYIYFRYLSDGSYVNPTTFTTTTSPSSNGTVVPGAGWKTTRYEVVNGMIIYPPSNLDTNTTINDLVMGIIVEHKNNNPTAAWNFTPVRIRSLEVASKLLNTETTKWKNGFGTKFANLVYPYTHRTADSSTVFNYKDKNPYKIYKSDLPYLYMTRNSGISVLSGYSNGVSDSRGIMIPVNEKAEASYSLSAMQMFLRYEAATFPATETKIFSLVSSGLTVDFYMIATTTAATRARIYAKNGANEYTNVKYYLNGVEVAYPVLEISEWSNVGIQFPIPISLNSEVADLRFTGPLMFNNLSYYQYVGSSNNVKYSQSKWNYYVHNSWTNVYNLGATSWNTVLSATVIENYGVDPIETYNSIIGTNKSIIDNTYIGEKALSIKNPSRKLITSAQWQTKTIKPV